MKSLSLDRIVGKRADSRNDYLQVKPAAILYGAYTLIKKD